MTKFTYITIAACLLGCISGCSDTKPVPKNDPSAKKEAAKSADAPEREVWDVCFVQGGRAGYVQTAYYQSKENGATALRIEGLTHIAVKRFGQETRQQIRCTSIETPDGRLLRFETQMDMGQAPLICTGRVVGKRLELETASQGKKIAGLIDWSPEYGGFYALEQSLSRKPMQPGENRSLQALIAGFNQLATVEMVARDWETTHLLHGTCELLRIDTMTIFSDGHKIEQTVWTDRTGDMLKTRAPAMEMETYRTTKAEALEKSDAAEFDIGLNTTVKLDKPLPAAHDTRRAVYRVHLDGSDPAAVFVAGPTQQVKSLDANTAEVTVYEKKGTGPIYAKHRAPTQGWSGCSGKLDLSPFSRDDLAPNNWIQSDNPKIIALAKEAAEGDWLGLSERKAVPVPLSPWDTAVRLEQFVHRYIKQNDFSQVFATAAEVADRREGDCTEYAVLLAALCRAREIPARVAIGLVYMPKTHEFGYHLWTEVYIDDKWIPIDATLGKGGIGAGHLKLAHSNLKGASAYSSFLPVVQVVGRLKIEIMEAE
jgi:hypothetical protein